MACDKSIPDSSNNNSNDISSSNNSSPNDSSPNDFSPNDSSPNNSSPGNNSKSNPNIIPNNPPRVYSPDDPRCIDCGHERLKCEICTPGVANVNSMSKKKYRELAKLWKLVRYCCKCTGVSRSSALFDSDGDEKHPLTKHEPSESEAAAQLRSFLLEALKGEQKFCPPSLCGIAPHFNLSDDDEKPGPGKLPITVMSCRIPQPIFPNTSIIYIELNISQVLTAVQRLICLLSSSGPIDSTVLRTTLRILFTRLAHLNHRAFPRSVQPSQHEPKDSKARRHFSRLCRDQVQTAYRELWYQALQAGFLNRVGSHGAQAEGLRVARWDVCELLVGLDQRAAIWQLLFRARELADKLRFWRAAITGRR